MMLLPKAYRFRIYLMPPRKGIYNLCLDRKVLERERSQLLSLSNEQAAQQRQRLRARFE